MSSKKLLYYIPSFLLSLGFINVAEAALPQNDPLYLKQWALHRIGAAEAWQVTQGSANVVVGMIDTGIDTRQKDLADTLWKNPNEIEGNGIDDDENGYIDDMHGWNFRTQTSSTLPMKTYGQSDEAYSHGTAVASILAARANEYGMVGIAPQVRIAPLVVLDGDGFASTADLAQAILYGVDQRFRILSISVSGYEPDPQLIFALEEAEKAGVLVVMAIGNGSYEDGVDLAKLPTYPACHGTNTTKSVTLRVTGTTVKDDKAPYANYGAGCTDISAPGVDLIGAHPVDLPNNPLVTSTEEYLEKLVGTSVATPLVSGTAALLASASSTLTAQDIRRVIIESSDAIEAGLPKGTKGRLGYGRLNAGKALALIKPKTQQSQQKPKGEWLTLWRFWSGR